MKDRDVDPMRWRDGPVDESAAGDRESARAASLVRQVAEPALPGPAAMDAIRARIVLRRGPRPRVRRGLVAALAAASLIFGAVLGAAAHSWVTARRAASETRARTPEPALPVSSPVNSARPPRGSERDVGERAVDADPASSVVPPTEPTVALPTVVPTVLPKPAESLPTSTRRPPTRLALAPAPLPERVPGAPVSEPRALGFALQKLRRENDPRGALDALDAYGRSFPNGGLRAEAGLVRVEALLALGERAEALRWLDALALDDGPRSRELLVLRGELRAAASRCSEAVKDLGRVLTPEPTDAVDERALFARASCFTKLHQFSAARADLQRYEARFPDAARAAEAERILRSLR